MKEKIRDQFNDVLPNQSINLYEGELILSCRQEAITGAGSLTFRWLPSPGVFVIFSVAANADQADHRFVFRHAHSESDLLLRIPGSSTEGSLAVFSSSLGTLRDSTLCGRLASPLNVGDGTKMSSAVLHAVNMRDFLDLDSSEPESRLAPILILQDLKWSISFTGMSNLTNLTKSLKNTGGFGITHVLSIMKLQNQYFSATELDDLCDALFMYLTFVEGRIVQPIFPVGYSQEREPIWQSWSPWMVNSWKGVLSWVDRHHGGAICKAFPGFMVKWADPGWQSLLKLVIPWYAHANRNDGGLENGIVLALTALDALTWQLLVIQEQLISRTKFKSLKAHDRIRLLFQQLNIPLEYYPKFNGLINIAAELKWSDSADAITTVRNNIVHPDAKLRKMLFTSEILYEAWSTSLWMLEMILLRVFCHSGGYSDRRSVPSFVGTITPVPWYDP